MKTRISVVGLVFALTSLATAAAGMDPETEERIDQALTHFVSNPVPELSITQHPEHEEEIFSRLFNISLSARAYLQLKTDPGKDRQSAMLLDKVAEYYLDNPAQTKAPHSSYWAGEYHASAIAMFGTNGTERKGAIPRDVEIRLLDYMVEYLNFWSKLDHYEFSLKHQTYYYWNSENHWWQEIVTAWGYLLVLKEDPDFRDVILQDGKSLQEHFDATSAYMRQHMIQRASKGFLTEISSGGYSGRMHSMYYLIYDLSPDENMKALAQKSLDLWWTFWAEEQISGERGGGKVRHRKLRGLLPNSESHMIPAWIYFGTGGRGLDHLKTLKDDTTAGAVNYQLVLSDYRPAPIIYAILEDRHSAPAYSITQRRIGKSAGDDPDIPEELIPVPENIYPIRPKLYDVEESDVLKYSWVSPNFVLGTNMRPPYHSTAWEAGSAQGWWHGLLLAGDDPTYPERVVPTLIYPKDAMGEQYAVQFEGSFIARKLEDVWSEFGSDNRQYPMGIFISEGLKEHTTVDGDIIFIDSPNAWVAIRAAFTTFEQADDLLAPKHADRGNFYRLKADGQPVIIEVAEHGDYASFETFRTAALNAQIVHDGGSYQYDSLSGKRLTMFDDRSHPMIDDQPVNYNPEFAYESRYVSSPWDSGIITITAGGQQHILDFTVH
ncbi:hypothetical protein [Aquisalinus flavus]|uniref:Uncharacterized protein n=1 Tax=Aquisalinus flavus TaxID=1526572 RepID=A0A8J2Y3Z4_9PROT|nr:hypothetical protein [Aquisalinus flavus]MBD0425947.1 hypothetical protein [Aquisalinus flavus]UNE48460.1 hypothetical protein FF099_10570 [Aquisalinus flavus]GGD11952.1 hypothetical protein GCM10011342_20960 [Aquisalinus flavus]